MQKEIAKELVSFIKKSPSCFHAIENMKQMLLNDGYEELLEANAWNVKAGGKYFVTRNQSSIVAVHVGSKLDQYSFNIVASHSDSPSFKVKENAQIEVKGKYTQLNTEGYGGMLCSTWLDRPLSLAGRALVKENDQYVSKLVHIDRDLLMIPNLAIHMNRNANDGQAYNKQKDMLPLLGGVGVAQDAYQQLIADELKVNKEDIYGLDMFLYNRMQPSFWGIQEEYLSCPQLDDLQCAFTSLKGFLKGYHEESIQVFTCLDNEEVGSGTKQGAGSTFLKDVLKRINKALGKTDEDYYRGIASGFMLSADNAHAVHPNYPEKSDVNNCVYMNEGIVIKSHAGQKYTSDAVSSAIFKGLCESVDVPVQFFANRSDMVGGSTLGNISSAQVSINCVDIGLAQLAMHSSYESVGVNDTFYMVKAIEAFYNTHFEQMANNAIKVVTR